MRIQTPERIASLLKDYPAISEAANLDPINGITPSLNIRVGRVDEQLLFFRPGVALGTEGGFYHSNDGLVGSLTASMLVVNKADPGKPRSTDSWGTKDEFVVRDILSRYDVEALADIAYLAYVYEFRWHETLQNWSDLRPPCPFGELKRIERKIVIYLPPQKRKGGLAVLYRNASFRQHASLTSREFIDGVCKRKPEFLSMNSEIEMRIDQFERSVYLDGGLRSTIDRSRSRGMSGTFADVQMRTFVSAGRVAITMERGGAQVTLLAAEEGSPRIGLHTLSGTFTAIKVIFDTVIGLFEKDDMSFPYGLLKDDKKVSIG